MENSTHNEFTLELVERYYKQELSKSELSQFEKRLATDHEFKQLVNDYQLLFEGIETVGMKAQLNDFHSAIETSIEPQKSNWTSLGIAASVIFLLGLAAFLLLNESKEEKLYTKYFKVDPGLPTLMGESEDYQFYNGMVSYKQGDYEQALSIWNTLDATTIAQDTLNYFKGVAYLADNQVDKAIKSFNYITQLKNASFQNETYYFLGLAYLKKGAIELAKKNLTLSTIDDSMLLLHELAK